MNDLHCEYRNAKSLVKHLLVADVTKRYGCLKNGANDIKNHRWFKALDWYKLSQKKIPAPYIPQIAKAGDTSNFSEYPDSEEKSPEVRPKDDPFLDWWSTPSNLRIWESDVKKY